MLIGKSVFSSSINGHSNSLSTGMLSLLVQAPTFSGNSADGISSFFRNSLCVKLLFGISTLDWSLNSEILYDTNSK